MSFFKNRFEIARVVQKLELSEYSAKYKDKGIPDIYVWVNIDQATKDEQIRVGERVVELSVELARLRGQAAKFADDPKMKKRVGEVAKKIKVIRKDMEAADEESLVWFSKIWSQHEDEKEHASIEDVRGFSNWIGENDEDLWSWIINRTLEMIAAHTTRTVKN